MHARDAKTEHAAWGPVCVLPFPPECPCILQTMCSLVLVSTAWVGLGVASQLLSREKRTGQGRGLRPLKVNLGLGVWTEWIPLGPNGASLPGFRFQSCC